MIGNQAAEGHTMPYFKEGSIVFMIEDMMKSPEVFHQVVTSIVSGCKCAIIDSPFTASLSAKGFVTDRVVGVGSIVCEPSCRETTNAYQLAEPAWGQGRIVKRGLECLYYGSDIYRVQLSGMGFRVIELGFRDVVERATKTPSRGLVILAADADPLEVEETPGGCGTLGTPNPLHPAAAFGKPGFQACARPLYRLVGPLARFATTLLYIDNRENTVLSRIEGLGNVLIIHTDPANMSARLQLASWLGVLYECGASEEYM